MKRQRVIEQIDRAIERAERHVNGDREECLPTYMDPQVERFLGTLRQMKEAIQTPASFDTPEKYMGFAIADGWPYQSELGKLVCEAEEVFHSEVVNKS